MDMLRSNKGRGFLISVHAYSGWYVEYKEQCVEKMRLNFILQGLQEVLSLSMA